MVFKRVVSLFSKEVPCSQLSLWSWLQSCLCQLVLLILALHSPGCHSALSSLFPHHHLWISDNLISGLSHYSPLSLSAHLFHHFLINCGESPRALGPEFGSCSNLILVSAMLVPGNDLQPGMWYSSVSLTKPGIITAMRICLVTY